MSHGTGCPPRLPTSHYHHTPAPAEAPPSSAAVGPHRLRSIPDGGHGEICRQMLPTATTATDQAAISQVRFFGPVCDSPSSSDESMNGHPEHFTPHESPAQANSPGGPGTTADGISRLSLEHRRTLSREHLACQQQQQQQRGRLRQNDYPPLVTKRSASSELTKPGGRQSPRVGGSPPKKPAYYAHAHAPAPAHAHATRSRAPRRGCLGRIPSSHNVSAGAMDLRTPAKSSPATCADVKLPSHRDSGYDSQLPSRQSSEQCHDEGHADAGANLKASTTINITTTTTINTANTTTNTTTTSTPRLCSTSAERLMARQTSTTGERWNIILQPDSSPISTPQLAAEVRTIYAGLVMVEAKCINIDAAQAATSSSPLGPEQWQALIGLHRTLLYEHHDFLMATQHPSSTPSLRGLANKYCMPARMWRHGIHAFLEVLRHRRPESQDYMLSFVYLAYQMMALLLETVPGFTDTWIECLGDLARYRMAIEEEREAHSTWGGVAARWYTMASDRHPSTGRLYHHLGILERPSLRKFCLYAKSLTCVLPFANARDSLAILCAPIVLDEQTIQSSQQSAEARIVTYHALVVSTRDLDTIQSVGRGSLQLLTEQPTKLRDFGAYFAATNIALLFEMGAATNGLWMLYNTVVNQATPGTPSPLGAGVHPVNATLATSTPESAISPYLQSTNAYFADSFNLIVRQYDSPEFIQDALSFVHVSLVCLHSLHTLRTRLGQSPPHTPRIPFDLGQLDFAALASFLTTLAQHDPITARMLECARQGVFMSLEQQESAKPLSEDYIIRGHIWSQFYFVPGFFDCQSEDDGRAIETAGMMKSRAARVLWLGLFLAFHTDHLSYDVKTQIFSAATADASVSSSGQLMEQAPDIAHPAVVDLASVPIDRNSVLVAPGSAGTTCSDGSEDGYTMIKKPSLSSGESQPLT